MLINHIKTMYYFLRIYFLIKKYKHETLEVDRDNDLCEILNIDLSKNLVILLHNSNRIDSVMDITTTFKKVFMDCYMLNLHILEDSDIEFIKFIKKSQDLRKLLNIEVDNTMEPFDNFKI